MLSKTGLCFYIRNNHRKSYLEDTINIAVSPASGFNNPWYVLTNGRANLVGNKAKGRISKRVFQENRVCQIFCKTNISYSLIRTRTALPCHATVVTFSKWQGGGGKKLSFWESHTFWMIPIKICFICYCYNNRKFDQLLLSKSCYFSLSNSWSNFLLL